MVKKLLTLKKYTVQLLREGLYCIKIMSEYTIGLNAMYLGIRQPHMQLIRSWPYPCKAYSIALLLNLVLAVTVC